jgi:hypothetical protein
VEGALSTLPESDSDSSSDYFRHQLV